MYRNKKDVDKYVENLQSKLSNKEFKTRAFSVARLYFDIGDYTNCQKYVEQYLTQKDNNAAAYKLLGQALHKLGHKDKALDHYKTSLDIDPTQSSTILDICELLADDDLDIEPGRAKYWCEKAEATFPTHPITFRLRERLVTLSSSDPEALVKLLTAEIAARPKDPTIHARLLKHYLSINKFQEAFEYACNVEFSSDNFINNYIWYETLNGLFEHKIDNANNWLYQLLLLTVLERICVLSLAEIPSGSSKSLLESNTLLHSYDQALESVAKSGAPSGFAEFHASLLSHHRGQFAFNAATLILKKAKKNQINWREAAKVAAPLMLIAWQTSPLDSKVNWLKHAPEKLLAAVARWYTEGAYRCSQSGHYLISNFQDKNQTFLDQISQYCSGTHWKDKLYETIFTNRNLLAKIKSSHFVSNAFNAPVLRLPRKIEVEAYDGDAQKQYGNSLHHFVWTLLNYKNYAHFKCTLFDWLTPIVTSYGPETLNKLDIHAFLYCAALTTKQQKANEVSYVPSEKPNIFPANITNLLCPLPQMKWWDCAYKFSQNILGTELTDIRSTLSRGIEVVRCVDNHGLDVELLCMLGRIFSERAKITTSVEDKHFLEMRACMYYGSAIPLLEKLKCRSMIKVSDKRMFDYTHRELETRELNALLEESILYVAVNYINDSDYDKAIEVLLNVKSVQAFYHLAQTHRKIAEEKINSSTADSKSKYTALLVKSKNYAYKALEMLKETEMNKNSSLYIDIQELIEDLEVKITKIEHDTSINMNDAEGKYSSDENISYRSEPMRSNNNMYRNISSTPKAPSNPNMTNYRSAIDSQILEMTRVDQQHLERIEYEIKNLQKRDTTISDFMIQTKDWFDENRKLGNQIISTINSNIQNTTDQFKLLKISVDQVKDQLDECRNECKDVGDLKKQIAELKKEVNKLKKSTSEQAINESELYNLEDEYRSNENASSYIAPQIPFPPQMLPQFNQRTPFPVPPNLYQYYNQSLYNLYNQYSQFAQPSAVPGAPPLFDSSRAPVNYSGVYPTPDQMFLDVAHLMPPVVPANPPNPPSNIPTIPVVPTMSAMTSVPTSLTSSTIATKLPNFTESKEISRSLPVNVVITSSDPLPTTSLTPAPVLSVTIPPKHIKGIPHNYQIAMPPASESDGVSPPVFSFSMPENKSQSTSTFSWKQAFQPFPTEASPLQKALLGESVIDSSKSVVDGPGTEVSPNVSFNKSRTLSEKSNTSVDYDPCPDFKPIVPLPAEVKVTTGEEDEVAIFSSRAKLFRFVDKQWKERGIGEMKLLKHKVTGKVRVLMRREQVHKICANHLITRDMEIKPMKNETKAYFWVANDFAEETLVLEKLCIRFKTADIAKDFYDAFEKSRIESKTTTMVVNTSSTENSLKEKSITQQFIENENTTLAKETNQAISSQNKTTIGGFTFSSTPVFKPVENDTSTNQSAIDTNTKTNVFSGLTFKSKANSHFSGLLNTPSEFTTPVVTKENQDKKLNTSDNIEEFEPNVEFKPVIPLPALVDQKTGEEDEKVLFEHRAKLLRFDSNTKEWKERGLGNIKLLVHKDNNQKIRLLMRREQIMKVCCNHILTKELVFQKMTNMDKAVTWCAKDFSEGELVTETFCLRFKTVQACDDFIEAIKSAQNRLKDDAKAAKEEQNAAKQISNSGFGDKFKPKLGAWNCESCYTNNLENFAKCACCDQPKPNSTKTEITSANKLTSSSWGDKFKPKSGSWECQSCFVMNEANVEKCNACNSFKDPTLKSNTKNVDFGTPKFEFGIPSQTMTTISNQSKIDSVVKSTPSVSIFNQAKTVDEKSNTSFGIDSGFGDKFKPKDGSWECKQCFVSNDGNAESCVACNSLKDPNAPKKSSVIETPPTSMKFRFGIAPTHANDEKPKIAAASIFDGTGAHKFSFGVPSSTTSVIEQKPTGVIFAAPKAPAESETPINFSLKKSEEPLISQTIVKPALLPTPNTDASTFASKGSGTGGFGFDPITFIKSPTKAHNKSQDDESDGEQYVKEEDCQAHFNPVIPIPDKVEVVTGEENETELYAHRARLYRFVAGQWKERGTGIVKILKHKETNKLRVVMRREQVFKICLNHALTPEIIYKPKDDKSWLFAANDFSEGELSVQQLVLRFQNKDIALQFKGAVDSALENKCSSKVQSDTNEKKDEDVVFVSEMQASAEDKKKAKELLLPDNFYNYKNKDPCRGCRGCKESDEITQETTTPAIKSLLLAPTVTSTPSSVSSSDHCTPTKSTSLSFQSPVTSVYGTPGGNMEKTFDTSIFRTPLSVNTKSLAPNTNNNDSNNIDATNKENIFMQKPNIFSQFSDQKFTTMSTSSPTLFGSGDSQTIATTKSSLIAPPKLTGFNIAVGNENTDAKSLFASAAANPVFGGSALKDTSIFGNTGSSTNKSVMCFSAEKTKDESNVKSLFGGTDQKPLNIFSGAAQGSLFGPGSLNNPGITTSGSFTFDSSSTQQNNIFTSIFSNNANNQSSLWKIAPTTEQKPEVSIFGATSENKGKIEETKADKVPEIKESPLKVDNNLTFAALTSSKAGFGVQKKADFKWEGEGEQLFTQNTSSKNDKSNIERANESATGDEEYDPHYEPIVPLPEKIVVTTGEEDEEKLFGERCKLFRFNDDTHEWKERGVGEMKILYHPEKKTYRLLLRREQVHKAVLNMLLFMEFELRPLKNSETAWMWVGSNFAETPAGEQEKLSARFKNAALAQAFHDTVVQCTRKLQSLAAQVIREEKEAKEQALSVPPLRLPKHLANSARADTMLATFAIQQTLQAQETPFVVPVSKSNGDTEPESSRGTTTESKQVTFREPQAEHQVEEEEEDDVDYDHDGYDPHDYEGYYNEEDGENVYYSCEGSAVVQQGDDQNSSEHAHIQVLFDPEIYSPKILVTDADTGEILADMLIHTDTEFHINDDTCSWSGTDYTTNEPLDKMVTVNFYDSDTAAQFLDSCETSKASTYSSQDPES